MVHAVEGPVGVFSTQHTDSFLDQMSHYKDVMTSWQSTLHAHCRRSSGSPAEQRMMVALVHRECRRPSMGQIMHCSTGVKQGCQCG